MTKVAFWFDAPIEYSGGLNYIKNLLYAISLVNDGTVQLYVFFPSNLPASIEAEFAPYATIIRTKLLERGSTPWFIHRVFYKFLGTMSRATSLLNAHGITVVSHVWFEYKGKVPFRIISWIPDFQYLHLPELFPGLNPDEETRRNQRIIAQSDINVLSSYCALEDFKRIAPANCVTRATVLQFVSQPRTALAGRSIALGDIQAKYGFQGKFFFLPNQFWAHKNHMVVIQAVNLLKDQGLNILVLCTGTLIDYRYKDTPYVDDIYAYIAANSLQDNVKILGLIDYDEVLFLMKNSVAVLNPSRFEGWSSSVEEAKSIGKKVILSNIDVHIEQNPPDGEYFGPDDVEALAKIMQSTWTSTQDVSISDTERLAREALRERTVAYGRAYLEILNDVVHEPSN
jgi:glycosyltransferase involved in cell wall biosynthesis